MFQDFKTEAEARVLLAAEAAKEPDWFCPLTQHMCRTDCVCFLPARLNELKYSEPIYRVRGHECGNAMFTEHEIIGS